MATNIVSQNDAGQDEVTLDPTVIQATSTAQETPSILSSLLQSAKKLPGQTVGGAVDLGNLVLGGYANIIQALQGQTISRDIGEGLVPKPVGGSAQLNDVFGIPNTSSGLVEDSASAVLGALNPFAVASKAAAAGKALIVGASTIHSMDEILQAKSLLAKGVDASEVFGRTGIYEGPLDGKMKSVINDNSSQINPELIVKNTKNQMILNPLMDSQTKLDELLGHPEAFDLYPELKDVGVTSSPTLPQGAAQAYPPVNGRPGRMFIGPMSSVDELHSAVLHETQHMIQGLERFSGGGSDSNFLPSGFSTSLFKIQSIAADLKTSLAKQFYTTPDEIGMYAAGLKGEIPPDLAANADFQLYQKTRNAQAVAFNAKAEAFAKYQRLGGEAEARSVQTAFDLGQTDSQLYFPLDLYQTSKGQYLDPKDLIASPFDKPRATK